MSGASSLNASLEHPHVCIALSEAATWGSVEQDFSRVGDAGAPGTDDILDRASDDGDAAWDMDDDRAVHGGAVSPGACLDEHIDRPSQAADGIGDPPEAQLGGSVDADADEDDAHLDAPVRW
eukprot:3661933-Pyramimonas_sp.AAC.1